MKNYNDMTTEEKNKADAERRAQQEYLRSIPGVIETLEKELAEKQKDLNNIKTWYSQYPDLKRNVNRWNRIRFCSASVNSEVTDFDMSHNCGCCSDSPLEVWPYLETDQGRLYSDPACYQVGEKHWISGDSPYEGWKKKLRDNKIPEDIIKKISAHFKADAEYRKELAEESDYDDEDEYDIE